MTATISDIKARQVLDSRGRPTVEAEVHASDGSVGSAMVPSGASTGRHEAVELRDGDASRYGGLGVTRAVSHVRGEIRAAVLGRDVTDQSGLDAAMIALDGTANKSRLGANAILGVSLAAAHCAAASRKVPLWRYLDPDGRATVPMPMVNMISGGAHAGGNLDVQDFLFVPVGATSYSQALEMTVSVYRAVGAVLREGGYEGTLVGDEGGYGPRLRSNAEALDVIMAAFARAGLRTGFEAAIALDIAANQFQRGETNYELRSEGRVVELEEWMSLLRGWVASYPIVSIEDPVGEEPEWCWPGLGVLFPGVQIVGDDFFVTNPDRVRRGIANRSANAVLVKVNQVGTLTETMEVVRLAREAGWNAVISARSGETEDTTLADLATATGAGQIKIGSVARSERLAKYNRLLRIEEELPAFGRFRVP